MKRHPERVVTWRGLLEDMGKGIGVASGGHDCQETRWLLEAASGMSLEKLTLSMDEAASPEAMTTLQEMLVRRDSGEPLQYVLGSWGFRSLDLRVDSRALIPRPETEVVVETALVEIGASRCGSGGHGLKVADLGTGTGAIALSIALEGRTLVEEVWASDLPGDALDLAARNLEGLREVAPEAAAKVRVVQGSWYEALPEHLAGCLAVIVANPPYVAEAQLSDLPVEVRSWEPLQALIAGPTGLESLEAVLFGAAHWLAGSGCAVVEIGADQRDAAVEIACEAGLDDVSVRSDLAGLPRVLVARVS